MRNVFLGVLLLLSLSACAGNHQPPGGEPGVCPVGRTCNDAGEPCIGNTCDLLGWGGAGGGQHTDAAAASVGDEDGGLSADAAVENTADASTANADASVAGDGGSGTVLSGEMFVGHWSVTERCGKPVPDITSPWVIYHSTGASGWGIANQTKYPMTQIGLELFRADDMLHFTLVDENTFIGTRGACGDGVTLTQIEGHRQ